MRMEFFSKKRLGILLGFFLIVFLVELVLGGIIFARANSFNQRETLGFLVLGSGGSGQEAADLTDTLILVLANQKTGRLYFFSLPRDIWLEPLKTKINSLYHYEGFNLVRTEVSSLVGLPIEKIILVDFGSFSKIIDLAEGAEVLVDRSFDDYFYPRPGFENNDCGGDPKLACRYETVRFSAGWQKMSAQEALKFSRSRHSADPQEGTDQARNQRQQKVMLTVLRKIASPDFFLNPQKVLNLLKIFQEEIKTDLNSPDELSLIKFFLPFWGKMKMETLSLEDFFYHPKVHSSGQWVLLPVGGNWEKLQEYLGHFTT